MAVKSKAGCGRCSPKQNFETKQRIGCKLDKLQTAEEHACNA